MKQDLDEQKGAVELVEDSFHLLRATPLSTFTCYYVGALPFVLGLLYFWSDMSGGVLAENRLMSGAITVALLFIWMKFWQSVFARKLWAQLAGQPEPPWDLRRVVRTVTTQTILHPWGLFLLPVAAVILIPLAWAFAFYQNVTVLGADSAPGVKSTIVRSWRQMKLWAAQNHCALMMLKLFGLFVFFNVVTAGLVGPMLLKSLFGVETAFTRSWFAALNTTFFASCLGLTYLCLDPIVKACYVLRCFEGQSLESAEDLRAELRVAKSGRGVSTVAACVLFCATCSFGAQRPDQTLLRSQQSSVTSNSDTISPSELDKAISQVIQQREYTWRVPRDKTLTTNTKDSWLQRHLQSMAEWAKRIAQKTFDWINKVIRWLLGNRRSNAGTNTPGLAWYVGLRIVLLLLCVAVIACIVFLLVRFWRQRQLVPSEIQAQAIPPAPDLHDENTGADQLPEDGWIALARELLDKGELRLALRAYYLASLAQLADRNLISIARYKSNRDYERELVRRAHALPQLTGLFSENVSTFDRVWYGMYEVTRDLLEGFASNVLRMKNA